MVTKHFEIVTIRFDNPPCFKRLHKRAVLGDKIFVNYDKTRRVCLSAPPFFPFLTLPDMDAPWNP